MLGDALEACQETEDDGENCHEDGEQNGREDTTDDANDDGRETANPMKPTVGHTQLLDVRQTTDECNWECPEDNLRGCG